MKSTTSDRKWSARIRERDGQCAICGAKDKRLNAHHLVPRQFEKYRLDMDNGITLCVTHHTFGKWSAHKNPIWFYEWMLNNRSEQLGLAISRLMELQNEI